MSYPTTAQPRGYLEVLSGTLAGRRYPLPPPQGSYLLGREHGCDIRFDAQRDLLVGRRHARIEARPDGIYLIDQESANGTFRDGQSVRGAIRLFHGDRFELGGDGGPVLMLTLEPVLSVQQAPPLPARSFEPPPRLEVNPLPPVSAPSPWQMAPARSESPPLLAPVPPPHWPPAQVTSAVHDPGLDALLVMHQRYYVRQIVICVVMLAGACAAGLAWGLLG